MPERLIDADVHCAPTTMTEIAPFLPEQWREYTRAAGFVGSTLAVNNAYPTRSPVAPPEASTAFAASGVGNLTDLQAGVLADPAVLFALLNCYWGIEPLRNPDFAVAMSRAVNDWIVTEWLDREPRLRASLVVPAQFPELAAEEIERLGSHPGFVRVLLPVRSSVPYGNRQYKPFHDAARRHGLALGIHFGGMPGLPPTPSGWPSFYIEEYAGVFHVAQSQLTSLVAEGTFETFPELRVVFMETGFAWLPSLMWRLDKDWKGIRREVPWVKELPSTYIREHVRFTTQPAHVPSEWRTVERLLDQIGDDRVLLYSSDFPHRHAAGSREFLDLLPTGLRGKVAFENASSLHGLG